MSDVGRRAMLDEFERAMVEFSSFVRALPRDLYDAEVPGEEGTLRRILGHVVGAGYGHLTAVARHCGGRTDVERRFTDPNGLDDPEAYVAAVLDTVRFARECLEGVGDRGLETRFASSWGQEYDGEQMLEHATCHPGRHIRQIERWLDGTLGS